MERGTVCILGGTGFVGKYVVARLVSEGYAVRVLTRHPHRHGNMKVLPGVTFTECNPYDVPALQRALSGCNVVINLVGILNQSSKNGFYRTHVQLPRQLIEVSKALGVHRFLQMSALGADTGAPSQYLQTKAQGEDFVHTLGGTVVAATSFRPSVIFGPEDQFFNRFASLLKQLPSFFPLACPDARFAPVYVGDVANAMVNALDDPSTQGKRIELCGPSVYTLRELVEYTARISGHCKRVIGLNDWASRLQASILGVMPGRPFTRDNYNSMQVPSTCQAESACPTSVEMIVPQYLGVLTPAASMQQRRKGFWVNRS